MKALRPTMRPMGNSASADHVDVYNVETLLDVVGNLVDVDDLDVDLLLLFLTKMVLVVVP